MRYYKGSLSFDEIMGLTIQQFNVFMDSMLEIGKMETGSEEEQDKSLTGQSGFAVAQRILPRKR